MSALNRFQQLPRRYPDQFGITALLCLVLIVFWPFLHGQHLFYGDLELYYYPVSEFWRRHFSTGTLPLWNPQLFGGVSYVGNPQVVTLYPPDMLLWWLPTYTAMGVSAMLHLWGSGSAFFLWMRRGQLRLSASAALLGAMCWMLGGAFVTKTQFPNMLLALAYLPAAIWAAEVLARKPSIRIAATLAAVLALQLLAAHAQISFLTIGFTLVYTVSEWWQAPRPPLVKVALSWGLALGLAVLLDAGQLFPVAETLKGAERQLLSLHEAERFYLPFWAVTHLFAPYVYGNPNNGTWTYFGGGNAWETACYLGVLPFLLALCAWKRGRFWSVAALICLIMAMGTQLGLFTLAYHVVPGLSRFHNAARFVMLGGLALAVLAALGLEKFKATPKVARFAPAILLLSALDLGLYAHTFYPLRDDKQMAYPAPAFVTDDPMMGDGQARIWCMNPRRARAIFLHSGDYTLRTPAHDALFPVGSMPDTQMWSGMLEAQGYDPIAPAVVAERLKDLQITQGTAVFPKNYGQQLSRAGIRLLAMWRLKPMQPASGFTVVYRGPRTVDGMRLTIYRNELCQPRGGGLRIVEASPNSKLIDISRLDSSTRTVEISDNFTPNWHAFLGGTEVKMKPTAVGTVEVPLPKQGIRKQLRLIYAPQSYRLGVFVTLCTLGLVVGLFCATKSRKRNESFPA